MTAFLALCFCIIGAGVMHSGQIVPETSAPGFARQVVALYSETLGEGAALLAAIAALSVMTTTVLAALDIGARNVASTWQQVADIHTETVFKRVYRTTLPVMIALTATVLYLFTSSFTAMLDLATSAVFLGAPIVATFNHLVVTRGTMPDEARPSPAIRALSLFAIVVMASLAVAYFAL